MLAGLIDALAPELRGEPVLHLLEGAGLVSGGFISTNRTICQPWARRTGAIPPCPMAGRIRYGIGATTFS